MSRHALHTQNRRDDRRSARGRSTTADRPRRRWTDRFGLDVLRQRWSNAMPKFFKKVCWLSALVGGTALAVNTAITSGGGSTHEWWNDIYPYLIGVPAGAAFVAKFTQNYDKAGNPIKKPLPEADQPSAVNYSDVETVSPDVHEIDPCDEV